MNELMNELNGFIRMSQSWVEAWAVHEEGRGGEGCADSVQFSTDIRSEISKSLNVSKLNTMYNALYMI